MATAKSGDMVPLNFLIPREMKAEIDRVAQEDRRTLAVTMRMIIERALEERSAPKKAGKRAA